jgi:hypothetical protein
LLVVAGCCVLSCQCHSNTDTCIVVGANLLVISAISLERGPYDNVIC